MSDQNSGTVARVVRVMQELAGTVGDVALSNLAEALALPPSTVHRLLQLLAESGIVERGAEGQRYRVGREFYRIALLVAANTGTREIARPVLRSLADACAETCALCEYLPSSHRFMVVDHVRSKHPLRYEMAELQPQSLVWGASGRSILAFLPNEARDAALADAGPAPATGTPPPPRSQMLRVLAEIRRDGYAHTEGQRIPGAVAFGAPVYRAGHEVFGGLCITIPEMRFDRGRRGRIVELLLHHARELSGIFGHHVGSPAATAHPHRARAQAGA